MALSAVLDHQTVRVTYQFLPTGVDNIPTDISFDLIHQFTTSDGARKSIVLQTQKVESKYFRLDGLSGRSELAQIVDVIFQNPRYNDGLFIQASGLRQGTPESEMVSVLLGDREGDFLRGGELPSNPARQEIPENVPKLEPVSPVDNVVVAEPPMRSVLYDVSQVVPFSSVQSGQRYVLVDNKFTNSPINQPVLRLMENSITNLAPNPQFMAGILFNNQIPPQGYEFLAPGFILNLAAAPGDIPDTNKYRVTGSNPNWSTSAFNTIKLRTIDMVPISYQSTYCYSMYVQSLTELPFHGFQISLEFFDAGLNSLGTVTKSVDRVNDHKVWTRYSAIFEPSDILPSAAFAKPSFTTFEVGDGSYFVMEYYAPQLEENFAPTSFVLFDRPQDAYKSIPLVIDPPFTIIANLPYVDSAGIRGIMEATGIKFIVNRNYLFAQVGSANLSATFTSGPEVELALYVSSNSAELLVDRQSIAQVVLSSSQNLNGTAVIGGLLTSNRTINSILNSFVITQGRPS